MKLRFLDLFDQAQAILQEKVGTKTYWVFAGEGSGNYPYTTLITTKFGNKAGGYYGWRDKDRAIKYIQEKITEAKNFIERKAKMRQENDLLAVKKFEEIQVGAIYETSWGYEAEWYEFYEVVDKKNGYVYLQKLQKKITDEECSYGYDSHGCVRPIPNSKDGDVIRRKVNAYGFNGLENYESCGHLYNPNKKYEEACWH